MAKVLPFAAPPRAVVRPAARDGGGAAARRQTPIPRRAARAVAGGVAAHAAAEGARLSERALAARFFPLALGVAAVDLLSKLVAASALADRAPRALGPLALQLVYNVGSAGGVMLGAHTRALNLAATGLVVGLLVLLVPALARVDRRSTAALALVAGGGLGNLVSLATSARGVEDFLAWRHAHGAVVVNVADLAMVAGLVLLGRTLWQLARAVRTHGPRARVAAMGAPAIGAPAVGAPAVGAPAAPAGR
jgi:lipoprotein signal peptidase